MDKYSNLQNDLIKSLKTEVMYLTVIKDLEQKIKELTTLLNECQNGNN